MILSSDVALRRQKFISESVKLTLMTSDPPLLQRRTVYFAQVAEMARQRVTLKREFNV